MLGLGSCCDVSDDEDMVIVSLIDFDEEEEEDDEDDLGRNAYEGVEGFRTKAIRSDMLSVTKDGSDKEEIGGDMEGIGGEMEGDKVGSGGDMEEGGGDKKGIDGDKDSIDGDKKVIGGDKKGMDGDMEGIDGYREGDKEEGGDNAGNDDVANNNYVGAGEDGAGDNGAGDNGAGDNGAGDNGAGDNGVGDNGVGDNDGVVSSLSFPFSSSIHTINEEEREEDEDANDMNADLTGNDGEGGRGTEGNYGEGGTRGNDGEGGTRGNDGEGGTKGSDGEGGRTDGTRDRGKNHKQLTLSLTSKSHHHPFLPSCAGNHANQGGCARESWRRAFRLIKQLKDPWEECRIVEERPSEIATRHRYHALRKEWLSDRVEVKMEEKAFDQGAMRCCYRVKKLPTHASKHKDWQHAHNYVAKQYLALHVTRDVYFSDVLLQMSAKLWGEEYSRHNPPKKVDIVQMCVLEMDGRGRGSNSGCLFHLEDYIEGDYTKYNSNSGFVEESLRLTPQAFSHFTFERSGHQLVVVDIQGVGDLWTDPQMHSSEDLFGEANLGCKGMALFFHSHQCNSICRSLALSPFDLASNELNAIAEAAKVAVKGVLTATMVRGNEEACMPTSPMQPSHLKFFLDSSRRLSSSGESEDDGIVDDVSPPFQSGCGDHGGCGGCNDVANDNHNSCHQSKSHHLFIGPYHSGHSRHGGLHRPPLLQRRRQRFYSESEDSASLNEDEEKHRLQFQLANKQQQRPACVRQELQRRDLQAVRKLSDSVLGQVHHELAKYHEMGRFVEGREEGDLTAALFHERCAAELGVKEAMVTMASIYFSLPRELLINVCVERTSETMSKGEEYLLLAAGAGDRGAMLHLAQAYHTGVGLSTDCKCLKKAVEWYEGVLEMQSEDEVGEFDPLVDTPPHLILATLASLYFQGDADLHKNMSYAGELYNRAAEEATRALKGRLAIKYYALAEEAIANGDVE